VRFRLLPYLEALAGVVVVTWLASAHPVVVGLASAALLYLVPVLLAATRGGTGPALLAALGGAAAYNYFLIEPRFTFQVHRSDNLVSVFVLVAVALVTSRLATRLTAREAEAREQARLSAEVAELSAILAGSPATSALDKGLAALAVRYGTIRLLDGAHLPEDDAAFSSLDLSAAAWSAHNGDTTGHGTEVMPAADWTFLRLAPKNHSDSGIAALARPSDGGTRSPVELEHFAELGLLLGQCRDRDLLRRERRERERLEQADELRRTFLASLAHDFRTPLTVLSGRLSELAPSSEAARDALGAAHRLQRLMADLIGAARLESGALAPARESIDLTDSVAAACAALVMPPGITLARAVPADLPFAAGDPVLLHHALVNLIDNALRHARQQVSLHAECAPDRILLHVDDDGPGIPEVERERIFQRFEQLHGNDRESGSGLGLAIVRGFAEAMGMTATASSAPLGGARLTLSLPAFRAAPR